MNPTRGPKTLIQLKPANHPPCWVPPITIIQDTREQLPYTFVGFTRIAGTIVQTLQTGDYAIAGAENLFRVERKRPEELFHNLSNKRVDHRSRFLREMERLSVFPHKYLVIEGTPEQIQRAGTYSGYHPSAVLGSLDAIATKFHIAIVYTDSREASEERVANLAAMAYAYHYATQMGFGACLQDGDL